jgi:hypothetical protein
MKHSFFIYMMDTFDQIFNVPADEWTIDHIKLYSALEKTLIKYRRNFVQAQFIQDRRDIIDNVLRQSWYKSADESTQRQIRRFLKQFRIATFSLLTDQQSFRMTFVANFEEAQLKLQYYKTPERLLYYLYFEPIAVDGHDVEEASRAYLAYNHPKRTNLDTRMDQSGICDSGSPKIQLACQLLGGELAKISPEILLRLVAEIIAFYDETSIVLNTPISPTTTQTLHSVN